MPVLRRAAKAEEAQAAQVVAKTHMALDTIADKAGEVETKVAAQRQRTRIPAAAQFPLAATLSFAMASLGYSLLGEVSKGELASVSRSQDTWGEVGVLAAWRM